MEEEEMKSNTTVTHSEREPSNTEEFDDTLLLGKREDEQKLYQYPSVRSIHKLSSNPKVIVLLLYIYLNQNKFIHEDMMQKLGLNTALTKSKGLLISVDLTTKNLKLTQLGWTIANYHHNLYKWALDKYEQKKIDELFPYKKLTGLKVIPEEIFSRIKEKLDSHKKIEDYSRLLSLYENYKSNFIPIQKEVDKLYVLERTIDVRIKKWNEKQELKLHKIEGQMDSEDNIYKTNRFHGEGI